MKYIFILLYDFLPTTVHVLYIACMGPLMCTADTPALALTWSVEAEWDQRVYPASILLSPLFFRRPDPPDTPAGGGTSNTSPGPVLVQGAP